MEHGGAPRGCRLAVVATELVEPRAFFVGGAPLSDHYGLLTTFRVQMLDERGGD